MTVFDIVRIVGPETLTSYPVNSRILVDHFDNELTATRKCDRYNGFRNVTDYRYEVEEHDELSQERAMPVK